MIARPLFLLSFLLSVAELPAKDIYQLNFKGVTPNQRLLELVFFEKVPPPDDVDRLLRVALEQAVAIDGSQDILATAFEGDDTLRPPRSSGPLFYKAAAKQILTDDAFNKTKSVQYDSGKYSVLVKDGHTLPNVKPPRSWLTVQVIFPTQPTVAEAYEAALIEVKKAASQGMDVSAYVYVGDKDKETGREQMKDPAGGYVFMRYEAASRKVFKRVSELVEVLP